MPNPYLDGIQPRHRRLWGPLLLAPLALFLCFRVLHDLFGNPDPSLAADFGQLLLALVVVLLLRRGRLAQAVAAPGTQEAEAAFLRNEHEKAVDLLRTALGSALTAVQRVAALHLLGRCAEARADFAEAAAVYAEALRAFGTRRGPWAVPYQQTGPVLAARRAFALAAVDRLDDADAVLAAVHERDAFPGSRALAVRAQAVVLAKRGDSEALVALLSRERVLLRNSLLHHDRLLLRALEAWARARLTGAFRTAPLCFLMVEPPLRHWIARVAPQAAEALGGAP